MADFSDLILSVTARLNHDFDFAFMTNNGDLANRLRSKLSLEQEAANRKASKVSVDEDGDIRIRFPLATCYVSAGAITIAGWLTTAKWLEEHGLDELSDTVEYVFEERLQFQRREYDMRLLIYSRSVSQEETDAALSKSCRVALESMFAQAPPPYLGRGRLLVEYQEGKFSDSLEFEASKEKEEVQLRYGRAAKAEDFKSYREFLRAADVKGLVEYLRPFAEIFQKLPLRNATGD
jgi:hypothetical protein